MADTAPSLAAAREHIYREHTLDHKPIRAHVIVTHDLYNRQHEITRLFALATRCDPLLLEDVTRSLLTDLLTDCKLLQDELRSIERWARAQIEKLPTKVRGTHER